MPTKRERMIEVARQYMPINYMRRFVAADLQKAIKAERAAEESSCLCVKKGELCYIDTRCGEVVCVTCGKVGWYRVDKKAGREGFDAGHFIGRRRAALILEETNIHTQCQGCNRQGGGMPNEYRRYMVERYGENEVARLEQLNCTTRRLTSDDYAWMVDRRLDYRERLARAEDYIRRTTAQ